MTYFDGGNKSDSRHYSTLSLASVSATKDLWHSFEMAWKRNLRKHDAEFLHVTDAVARTGIYERWSEDQRDSFISDCVRVAQKHISRSEKLSTKGQYGIFPSIVAIELEDFVDNAKVHPLYPQNADQTALRHCIANVTWWAKEKALCSECSLFFDQGEPFLGCLTQMMQSKKAMNDARDLMMIISKVERDSRREPALQLADLYAWCVSHRSSQWHPRWLVELLSDDFHLEHYDRTVLGDVNMRNSVLFESWKIPKRAKTK